jgi:hypothetical protein
MYIFRVNQATWKRIVGRVLFNYFAICYRVFDVLQPYMTLSHGYATGGSRLKDKLGMWS